MADVVEMKMGVDRHGLRGASTSASSSICSSISRHLPLVFVVVIVIFIVIAAIVVVRSPGGRADKGRGRRRVRQSSHLQMLLLLLLLLPAGSIAIITIMVTCLHRRGATAAAADAAVAVHRYHSSLHLFPLPFFSSSAPHFTSLSSVGQMQTWAVRRPPNWISEVMLNKYYRNTNRAMPASFALSC